MPGESCPECLWLIGHLPGCTLTPKTERELGWNEAIEAAATAITDVAGLITFPLSPDTMAATVRSLKK